MMCRMISWLLVSMLTCPAFGTIYISKKTIKQVTLSLIQSTPTLLVLIPAYILYAEHHKLGTEPISEHLFQRISKILIDMNVHEKKFFLKKLHPCFILQREECEALQSIMPIHKKDNRIVILPAPPHTLYINEQVCAQLTDQELSEQLLASTLFIKQRTLEKTILSAIITPVATDYGTRLLSYLIDLFVESICAELSTHYPAVGFILCKSNSILEWLLTNVITKFILNLRTIQFLTKYHLKAIENQAQKLLNKDEQNSYFTTQRSPEDCCWRSY